MTKAATPITGGINWPPVEAIASVAAARSGGTPDFTIKGIVNTPTAATLATALPVIVPIRLDPTTATFWLPPVARPTSRMARSMNNFPPPMAAIDDAESDEVENESNGGLCRDAEDAARRQHQDFDELGQREAPEPAERQQKGQPAVKQESQDDPHQNPAGGAPHPFHQQQDEDDAEDNVLR